MNYMAAVWLITAVVLGIIESITVALVSIWMAIGAFAAAVFAFFGFNTAVQVLVFAAVSALMLILTAPLSKRFRQSKKVSTNADRLIGQEGVVLRRVDPIENKGQIKVMGQIWSAEGADGTELDIGEKVIVKAIEGVHVIVDRIDHNQ